MNPYTNGTQGPNAVTPYNTTSQVSLSQSQGIKGNHLVSVRRNGARHVVPVIPFNCNLFL